jgi:hypothetical protein
LCHEEHVISHKAFITVFTVKLMKDQAIMRASHTGGAVALMEGNTTDFTMNRSTGHING